MTDHHAFTGTQGGMEPMQIVAVYRELLVLSVRSPAPVLHHGDCVGADAEVHRIALILNMQVILHPMSPDYKRAFCTGAILTHDPLPGLDRNQVIVDESSTLTAGVPGPESSHVRSGTWATVRRARSKGIPRRLCWPDGHVTDDLEEHWWRRGGK